MPGVSRVRPPTVLRRQVILIPYVKVWFAVWQLSIRCSMVAVSSAAVRSAGTEFHRIMAQESQPARERLSPEDWVMVALAHVAEQGFGNLAIEGLARDLGVTKGSFYWHFRNRDALVAAMLARWREQGEANLLHDLASLADPRRRLRELFRRVAADVQSNRVHAAFLKALDDPRVRAGVEAAAARFIDLIAAAYRELGQTPQAAQDGARLAYAAYLGFMQMNQVFTREPMSREKYDEYIEHLIATLVP